MFYSIIVLKLLGLYSELFKINVSAKTFIMLYKTLIINNICIFT